MSGIFDQVINYAPPSLLLGTVTYKGTWSAATNTPTLANPPSSITNGNYYVVSAAGTQFSLSFNIGDWIISNGSAWEKVDNTDAVSSVFGRTGAVVGVSTDYSSVGITATAVGASSPSTGAFTTLSATTPLAVASGGTGVASSTGTTNVVLSGSPTITTPVIAQINDASGNATVRLTGITSATDYLEIKNGIGVGSPLHVLAEGTSANIGMHVQPKGTGLLTISDGVDFNKGIRFRSVSSAASAVTLIDAVSTAGRVITLPDATDTLVGKATTDTLTNKTLTSPTITGGALNGTLGATTPSTVAGTTGVFNSNTSALTAGPATTVLQVGGADSTNPRVTVDAFAGVPVFSARRANTSNAAKSAILSGDQIMSVSAFGYKATGYSAGAGGFINWTAAENWTDTAIGTNSSITLVPNGSLTQSVAFNFANTGIFSISGGATPGINSTAIGNVTPSTGAFSTLSVTSTLSTTPTASANSVQGLLGSYVTVVALPAGWGTVHVAAAENGTTNIGYYQVDFVNGTGIAIQAKTGTTAGATTGQLTFQLSGSNLQARGLNNTAPTTVKYWIVTGTF